MSPIANIGPAAARSYRLARAPGRRWRGDEQGAAAVEFAFVGPPFLAILVALLQSLVVFFAQRQLDETVTQAGRSILTGQAAQLTAAQFSALLCQDTAALLDCSQYMVNIQNYSSYAAASTQPPGLNFDAQGRITNNWQFSLGNPGDVIVLQVMYPWPAIAGPLGFTLGNLPNGARMLVSSYVFKREPV